MPSSLGRAASLLREAELVSFLVHPDADSVLAAGLLGAALERARVPWHARFAALPDREALAPLADEAPGQPVVLVGLGGTAEDPHGLFDAWQGEVVVLDARWPRAPPKRALQVEEPLPAATAAVLAYDLARTLDPRASALVALAGLDATGPFDGASGLRARLLAEAAPQGGAPGAVPGLDGRPLLEALAGCAEPFLPGLSGRARAAKKFLDGLALPAEVPVSELDADAAGRLASGLTLHLLARGAPALAPRALLAPDGRGPVPGGGARALARLVNAACASQRPGLGLALALGDPRPERDAAALAEAREQRLLQALLKLEGDGTAAGPWRADADLAADLAWAGALALRGGEPVAAQGGSTELHVAAPTLDPRFLGQAAAEAARAVGGVGGALGHRARLDVPAGQAAPAWEHLRRQLGVLG